MTSELDKRTTIDKDSFPYIFIQHKDIPLKTGHTGVLRCNVYLPKDAAPFGSTTYPVLATYGPCAQEPSSSYHPTNSTQMGKTCAMPFSTPSRGRS